MSTLFAFTSFLFFLPLPATKTFIMMKKHILIILLLSLFCVSCQTPNGEKIETQAFEACDNSYPYEETLQYEYTNGTLQLHYTMLVNCAIYGAKANLRVKDKELFVDVYLKGKENLDCVCGHTLHLSVVNILPDTYTLHINTMSRNPFTGIYEECTSYSQQLLL